MAIPKSCDDEESDRHAINSCDFLPAGLNGTLKDCKSLGYVCVSDTSNHGWLIAFIVILVLIAVYTLLLASGAVKPCVCGRKSAYTPIH